MAARPTNMLFVKRLGAGFVQINYDMSMTILDIKRQIQAQINVPIESMKLMGPGLSYEDHRTIASYNIARETTITLILSAAPAPPTAASSTVAAPTGFSRSAFQPLPVFRLRSYRIPGAEEITKKELFVWCTAQSKPDDGEHTYGHKVFADDSYDVPYTHQVQPGSVRPVCSVCKNESVLLSSSIDDWSQAFAGVRGECFVCNREVLVELMFKCKGELLRPDENGRTLCNAVSTQGFVVPLPGIEKGRADRPSLDTGDADALQVVSHPCGHAFNANTLNLALENADRSMLVQNELHPVHLGHYLVKCLDRACDHGVIFRPTVKFAGDKIYSRIKDWAVKEEVLRQGGLICSQCSHAFLAARTQWRHTCPNCHKDICEMCNELYQTCAHGSPPDEDAELRARIIQQIALGQTGCCPRGCRSDIGTQKDNGCTHMKCEMCRTDWCYFCGQVRPEYFCKKGCPWFLDSYHLTQAETKLESLAKFHRLKVCRLLRQLRAEEEQRRPGAFDRLFARLPPADRTFICDVLTQVVELPEVLAPPPEGDFVEYTPSDRPNAYIQHVRRRRPLINWP